MNENPWTVSLIGSAKRLGIEPDREVLEVAWELEKFLPFMHEWPFAAAISAFVAKVCYWGYRGGVERELWLRVWNNLLVLSAAEHLWKNLSALWVAQSVENILWPVPVSEKLSRNNPLDLSPPALALFAKMKVQKSLEEYWITIE